MDPFFSGCQKTRFAAAADPIKHISEEKFLLQIFAKMEGGPY